MAVEILPLGIPSIIAIAIMIGGLITAYVKKWLMTYALIITNFIIFVITLIFRNEIIYGFVNEQWTFAGLGFKPIYLTPEFVPQIYTLFTSMFIHADFLHIIGNMLIFFFIGMAFEQRVGWKKFIIIYLIAGICGSLTHSLLVLFTYTNQIELLTPLVGASGAIFGIMGAFAFAYPNDQVIMPIPIGFIMVIRRIRVIYAVLLFAVFETIIVLIGDQSNTAHFAHFGGLVGGVILSAIILKNRKTPQQQEGYNVPLTPMYSQQKPKKFQYTHLEQLATTPELQIMLDKIKQETVPQVQEIWLEHFLEKVQCPKCSSPLNHFHGKIWCDQCGFKDTY